MAARSELGHRLREIRTSIIGRLAPKILSRKTSGLDGLVKKIVSRAPTPDDSPDPELLHPDVPEILSPASADRSSPERSGTPRREHERS